MPNNPSHRRTRSSPVIVSRSPSLYTRIPLSHIINYADRPPVTPPRLHHRNSDSIDISSPPFSGSSQWWFLAVAAEAKYATMAEAAAPRRTISTSILTFCQLLLVAYAIWAMLYCSPHAYRWMDSIKIARPGSSGLPKV